MLTPKFVVGVHENVPEPEPHAVPVFEVLAQNTLEDDFDASPAIAGDELYLRGHRSLYCIAQQ